MQTDVARASAYLEKVNPAIIKCAAVRHAGSERGNDARPVAGLAAKPGLRSVDRAHAQAARDRACQGRASASLPLRPLAGPPHRGARARRMAVPGHQAPNAALVDHITPHRGDLALFFDPANCRSVSKEYHDSEKQRAEKVAPTAARGPGGGPIP